MRTSSEQNTMGFNTVSSSHRQVFNRQRVQSGRIPMAYSRSGIQSRTGATTKDCSNYDSMGQLHKDKNPNYPVKNLLTYKASKDRIDVSSGGFDSSKVPILSYANSTKGSNV